jgi:hypothetical protein
LGRKHVCLSFRLERKPDYDARHVDHASCGSDRASIVTN